MDENLPEQKGKVEYSTPTSRKPDTTADVVAFISSMLAATFLVVATRNVFAARILFAVIVIGATTGLVFGLVGLRRARAREGVGRGQAWVAVIIGGVMVLLLIGVLILRSVADRTKCQHNLSAIGSVILLYPDDHGGQLPLGLGVLVRDYGVPAEIFVCETSGDTPASGATTQLLADFAKPGHCSYVYLGTGKTSGTIAKDFVLAYEPLENHRGKGAHFLFGNGWAEWRDAKEARKIIEQLKKGMNPPKQ